MISIALLGFGCVGSGTAEVLTENKKLIEARQNARKEKNWAEADRIRDLLKDMGIVLMDTKQGVQWKKA